MRFDGLWERCEDGVVRPLLSAEVLSECDSWHSVAMLIDTGADRTVLSADVWKALNMEPHETEVQIGGVGGFAEAVRVRTKLRLERSDGKLVTFRVEIAACLNAAVLDMSVLGRDIIDMFTLVADREGGVLTLLGGNHHYSIHSN
jgi:predicted aspartyl protease